MKFQHLFPWPALLAAIAIIGLIILTPTINSYGARGTQAFSEAYYPTGIFTVRPVEILGVDRLEGTSVEGNFLDISGQPADRLVLRFLWQSLRDEPIYQEYDFTRVNWEIDDLYTIPLLKLNFRDEVLRRPVRIGDTGLDYRNLFALSESITIYGNQETYDAVMDSLR